MSKTSTSKTIPRLLPATYDVVFKKLFGDKENEVLLRSLLTAILNVPAEELGAIEYLNSEMLPQESTGKFCRLDLRLRVGENKINIELQKCSEKYYNKRLLYYWCQLYANDLHAGDSYGRLLKTISINLLDYIMFDYPDYHLTYHVNGDKYGDRLTDDLQFDFLELPKVPKISEAVRTMDSSDLAVLKQLWGMVIFAEGEEDFAMMEQASVQEIRSAVSKIRHYSADEKVRYLAQKELERQLEEKSALEYAEEKGIEKGKAEGKAEGKTEVALAMLQKGYTIDQIMELTGLSEQQIRELRVSKDQLAGSSTPGNGQAQTAAE